MATTEPIKNKSDLTALAEYFQKRGQWRNYALIVIGVHTALRIGDLLKLQWNDVYDEKKNEFRTHLSITEQKTGKSKIIALNAKILKALKAYYPHRKNQYLFASRNGGAPLSRIQAYRVIRNACIALGIDGKISCHSLRKTWGYHAWTSQKVSPVIIMEIYNHSSFSITKRYLGITQDDLDKAYLSLNLL